MVSIVTELTDLLIQGYGVKVKVEMLDETKELSIKHRAINEVDFLHIQINADDLKCYKVSETELPTQLVDSISDYLGTKAYKLTIRGLF